MISENDVKKFTNFVSGYNNFLVVGHKGPDGDCLCSAIALSDLLRRMGKNTTLLSAGPFTKEETLHFEKYFTDNLPPPDKSSTAVILEDCSEFDRVGHISHLIEGYPCFVVDHHKTADADEKTSIIYPQAPATALLVQLLYEKILGKIPEGVAQILFFGLCTDSGFFRFLETGSAPIFQAAARLVEAGANPRKTFDKIASGKSPESRQWLGEMLSSTEMYFNNKLICLCESPGIAQKYGSANRDTAVLYDQLLCIKGVEAILFIRQDDQNPSASVASFRSNDETDVSAIAAELGGGGHRNAAGLSMKQPLSEAKAKILSVAEKFFS